MLSLASLLGTENSMHLSLQTLLRHMLKFNPSIRMEIKVD